MSTRLRRSCRGVERSLCLTPRDLAILRLVAACGYVSSDQIARTFFRSADRCRQRLRQLYDARLIEITIWDSRSPNLVSLSRRGRGELAHHDGGESDARLPGTLRLSAIPHHLALIEAKLYMAALGELRRSPLRRFEGGRGKLAQELGLPDLHVVPDALATFELAGGGDRAIIAIEVDCRATESKTTVATKVARYAAVARETVLDALWIAVAAGAERQRTLEGLVAAAGLDEWARVLLLSHMVARPVQELPERRAAGSIGRRPNMTPSPEPIPEGEDGV